MNVQPALIPAGEQLAAAFISESTPEGGGAAARGRNARMFSSSRAARHTYRSRVRGE